MINLGKLDLQAIAEQYMIANTPRFLYKHLRQIPSVRELAVQSTPRELLKAIDAIEQKQDRNADDIATAYAMLVALSFQEYGRVREAVAGWTPTILSWGLHILSIIEQTTIPTQRITLVAPAASIGNSSRNTTPTEIVVLPR